MKIHNVRHGFATNSSSSHSIVFLPRSTRPPGDEDDGDYGWNDFVLASPEAKNRYLRQQYGDDDNTVDHQSVWNQEGFSFTERVTGVTSASAEGRALMEKILASSRTVILGGNDSQDPHHPLTPDLESAGAGFLDRENYIVVNDPKGHVVFFDPKNGTKFRATLDDNAAEPTKGTWPELLDVKITNYCPYRCEYCYQDSTEKGHHAPLEYIENLAAEIKGSGVLEVAIGGGEPTMHPNFADIVRLFREAGVVVNVTSRNVAMLVRAELRAANG